MMNSLNGWKRLGIVVSVLWILGSSYWLWSSEINILTDGAIKASQFCSDDLAGVVVDPDPYGLLALGKEQQREVNEALKTAHKETAEQFLDSETPKQQQATPHPQASCHEQLLESLKSAHSDAVEQFLNIIPFFAIIPVAVLWAAGYIIVWIGAGFKRRAA